MATAASVDGTVSQTMRFLDEELRELATFSESDLPAGERCSAALRAFESGRWATVCANPDGRYASVLIIDGSYRISQSPVTLKVRERIIAWTAMGGSIGILTDRARHVRVPIAGDPTSFWLGEPDGRTVIRIAREIAPGIAVAQLNIIADGEPAGDIAILDLATGRVLARAAQTGHCHRFRRR